MPGPLTSHRCLREARVHPSTASKLPSPSCPTRQPKGPQPFPQPSRGSGTPPGQHQQPRNSQGPSGVCFSPAFPQAMAVRHTRDLAAPHWRSPFSSRVVPRHLLASPSAQVAKPVANPQMCPPCLRWPWPRTKAESTVSHSAQAAPPSFALAGDRSLSGHPGLAATLGPEVRHRGLQLRQSHGRSAGSQAGTREFRGWWFRAEQWREGSGHSRDTRRDGSVQDTLQSAAEPPRSSSSAGTAPPWQPLGSPGETAGPGLLQPFPILCKSVVIKTR